MDPPSSGTTTTTTTDRAPLSGTTATTADSGSGTKGGTIEPFDAPFLWDTLRFDDAVDLGHEARPVAAAEQVAGGAVLLTEVSKASGLATATTGGNSHGVGVGFFDFDGDGWEDILVASGHDNQRTHASSLWRNLGDGTFADVSAASNLSALLADVDAYSVAAADYDADGDLDVYLGAHPTSRLLRNEGDGTFTDQSTAAMAGGPPSTRAANGSSKIGAWGDVDGDGWLDIVVASSTFDDAPRNGYLLQNNRDGTFADISEDSAFQVASAGNPCAVLWSDYDNDGDQDLIIWNDRGGSTANRALLRNDGGTWTDVTVAARMTNPMGNPMGIDGADIDRNGFLDYYIGNIGGNALLLAQADGTFVDFALSAGVRGSYGWGLGFEDLNADGWWDIFIAEEDARPYLTFTHNGDVPPTFTEATWAHPDVTSGHNVPVAFADYDRDGDVDVVSANTDGHPLQLFRNDTERGTQRFLEVQVAASPMVGARGGISGRVVVKAGNVVLWRDLTGGSSRASQNALSARFGLGQRTGADWVAVLWPDGRQLTAINVAGDQRVMLGAP